MHAENNDVQVLGFPCNQFGKQEPGTNAEIHEFATSKFDVNFPIFAKIEVNGDGACDLYKWLKSQKAKDDGVEDLGWNFTKFMVGKDGEVVTRFEPQTTPEQIGEYLSNQ